MTDTLIHYNIHSIISKSTPGTTHGARMENASVYVVERSMDAYVIMTHTSVANGCFSLHLVQMPEYIHNSFSSGLVSVYTYIYVSLCARTAHTVNICDDIYTCAQKKVIYALVIPYVGYDACLLYYRRLQHSM